MNSVISIVVMAFNEAKSLGTVVAEIDTVLAELNRPYEVIIVDDGSSDGTREISAQLAKENSSVRVIRHETNKGLGEVYRTGFMHAKGDFITFFPADGQFPINIIEQFLPLMNNTDMVLGYLPERDSSLLAKCLSGLERALFGMLFGRLPRFQGVMMFKRALLNELKLKSSGRGWTVLMELIIRARKDGYKITSVPTEFRPRLTGRSKVNNLPTIWANLRQVIVLRRHLCL